MILHGNIFILHLYKTWNKYLEMVGRHCMMGSVGGKNLRTPLIVVTKRCNILQDNFEISFVSCATGVSTLWKQHSEHFRTLFKPIKSFPQVLKTGHTVLGELFVCLFVFYDSGIACFTCGDRAKTAAVHTDV